MPEIENYITFGWFGLVCAIIAAKWAADIGLGQVSQLLWAILTFLLPPVGLLALYVRHVRLLKEKGLSGGRWVSMGAKRTQIALGN